ncbi:MAG: 5-formyltetrahydrofolate cyclo-ligase [Deltaproteobacteria bacterium]|nr:MAG: 5-formyltetrahydrofolate cyclo-ligase [Deltaproteobacteria bacterium]
MENIGDKKVEILNEINENINQIDADSFKKKREHLIERLFEFANFLESKTVLFYMNSGIEIETLNIIKRSLEIKKTIVLPVVDTEKLKLNLYKIESLEKDLRKGASGIVEPIPDKCKPIPLNQIDIAIIPGIAFDEKGGRIGLHNGFYGKLITKLPITTRKVSIAFDEQVVQKQIPMDSRKKCIDIIITDKRTIYKI